MKISLLGVLVCLGFLLAPSGERGPANAAVVADNRPTTTFEKESFTPAIEINTSLYLVSITTIKHIPGYPNVVVRVPCFMPSPPPPLKGINPFPSSATKSNDARGFCTAQHLPNSAEMINQRGDIITPP